MAIARWNIDPNHSRIGFSVRHLVISKVRGHFGSYQAELELDEEDLSRSRVTVEIDAASIDTGVEQRDTHLRSPDFFAAETFPKLRFVSRRVEKAGKDEYKVIGDLTIRDVTREVTLAVEDGGRARDPWGNDRAAFAAHLSIDRKAFGLTWNQVLETGGLLVADRVDIELELEAVKQVAASRAA
jgi:polyisoprenoid-binding protein YceI